MPNLSEKKGSRALIWDRFCPGVKRGGILLLGELLKVRGEADSDAEAAPEEVGDRDQDENLCSKYRVSGRSKSKE